MTRGENVPGGNIPTRCGATLSLKISQTGTPQVGRVARSCEGEACGQRACGQREGVRAWPRGEAPVSGARAERSELEDAAVGASSDSSCCKPSMGEFWLGLDLAAALAQDPPWHRHRRPPPCCTECGPQGVGQRRRWELVGGGAGSSPGGGVGSSLSREQRRVDLTCHGWKRRIVEIRRGGRKKNKKN